MSEIVSGDRILKTIELTGHVKMQFRHWLSFLESILLPLIEEVSFGAPKVDNLWTAITLKKRENSYNITNTQSTGSY